MPPGKQEEARKNRRILLALILASVGVMFLTWDAYNRHRYVDFAFALLCEWMLLSRIWSKS